MPWVQLLSCSFGASPGLTHGKPRRAADMIHPLIADFQLVPEEAGYTWKIVDVSLRLDSGDSKASSSAAGETEHVVDLDK